MKARLRSYSFLKGPSDTRCTYWALWYRTL